MRGILITTNVLMNESFSSTLLSGNGFSGTRQTGYVIPPLIGRSTEGVLKGAQLTQNLVNVNNTSDAVNYLSEKLLKLFVQNYNQYNAVEDRYLHWENLAPQVSYIHNITLLSYLSNPLNNRPLGLSLQMHLFEDSSVIREKLSTVKLWIPNIATSVNHGALSSQPVRHEIVRAFHDESIETHLPIERRIITEITKTPSALAELFRTDNVESQKELLPYVEILRKNFLVQLKEAINLSVESLKKGKINTVLHTLVATAPTVSELKAIGESASKNLSAEQILDNVVKHKEIMMFGLTKQTDHFLRYLEDTFHQYTSVLMEYNPSPTLDESIQVEGVLVLDTETKSLLEKSKVVTNGFLKHTKDVQIIYLDEKDMDQKNRYFTKSHLRKEPMSLYNVSYSSPSIMLSNVPGENRGTHYMNFPVQYHVANGRAYVLDNIDDAYSTSHDKSLHPLKNELTTQFHTLYNWLNPQVANCPYSNQNVISFGTNEHQVPCGAASLGIYDKCSRLLFIQNQNFKHIFTNPILYTDKITTCLNQFMDRSRIGTNQNSHFTKFLELCLEKIENYDFHLKHVIKNSPKNYDYTSTVFTDVLYSELHPFFDLSVVIHENKKVLRAHHRVAMANIPYYLLPLGAHVRRGRQLLHNVFQENTKNVNAPTLSPDSCVLKEAISENAKQEWKAIIIWADYLIEKLITFCNSVFGEKAKYINLALGEKKFFYDDITRENGNPFHELREKPTEYLNIFSLCVLPILTEKVLQSSDGCHNDTYVLFDTQYMFLPVQLDLSKFEYNNGIRENFVYEGEIDFPIHQSKLFTLTFNKTVNDILKLPCSHLERICILFTSLMTITPDSFALSMDFMDPGLALTLVKSETFQTEDVLLCRNEAQTCLLDTPKTEVKNMNEDNSSVVIQSSITMSFLSNAINASATCYNHANLSNIVTDMGCEVHYYDTSNVASGILPQAMSNLPYFSSSRLAREYYKNRKCGTSIMDDNITRWIPIICPPHVPVNFVTSSHNPRGRNTLFMGLQTLTSDHCDNWQPMFDHAVKDGRFKEFHTTVNPWASQAFSLGHCMYSRPTMKINGIQNKCFLKIHCTESLPVSCFFEEPDIYKIPYGASNKINNSIFQNLTKCASEWRIPGNRHKFPSKSNTRLLSKRCTYSDDFSRTYGLSQPRFSFTDREIAAEYLHKLNRAKHKGALGYNTNSDSLEECIFWKGNSYLIPGSTFFGPLERGFNLHEFLFHTTM